MDNTSCAHKVRLDLAFPIALISIGSVALSSVLGYFLAEYLYSYGGLSVTIYSTDPYVGCALFPEFTARAAALCRPALLQSLILWIAPYTAFGTPLTAVVFMERGLALGLALRFCTAGEAALSVSLLLILHTLVTAIFLFFAYSLRNTHTVRPMKDTLVHFLIMSGFTFAVYIASPWIL